MPNYEWKPISEIVRAVALAAVVFVAIALLGLASVTNWATYGVTFGTGLASAIGTAILGVLTKPAP